jgi:hypothetical protein
VTCSIVFILTDEEYIVGWDPPMTINSYLWSDPTHTITIKPAPGVTPRIRGSQHPAIFEFNGTSYITIDGSNTSGGDDRSLTIENNYGGFSTAAIRLSHDGTNGVQHCVIKNCILKGGNMINAGFGENYGIYAIGGGHNDLTIQNNEFQFATTGLYLEGNASYVSTNGMITKNIFGSTYDSISLGYAGIETRYTDGFVITDNIIQNIYGEDDNVFGIIIGVNSINTTITKNLITAVKYTGNGGYGGKGMEINTGQAVSNILIVNNVISDISGDGYWDLNSDAIVGIRILYSTGGVSLYYNSIDLFGNITGSDEDNVSAAIYFGYGVSDIDLKNNVFTNSLVDVANDAYAFSIYSDVDDSAFTGIDYNDYYVSGTQGILGHLNDGDIFSLPEWQTESAQDASSLSEDPLFISDTDLHPDPGSPLVAAGTPISGVPLDFDDNTRDLLTPTIGAYEITPESLKTWNGNVSSSWDVDENWTPEGVPVATDNLSIPTGTPECILNATGLFCKHITIEDGATVLVDGAARITIMGNLTLENGAVFTNDGLLILKGNLINLAAGK